MSELGVRLWLFSGRSETLASIRDDQNVTKFSTTSLGEGFEVRKPSTLILKDVTEDYDGKYEFRISSKDFSVFRDADVTVVVLSKYVCNSLLFTVWENNCFLCGLKRLCDLSSNIL